MFFPLSADSAAALATEAAALASKVESSTEPLSSLAADLADRPHGPHRAVVVAADRDTLTARLRAMAADEPGNGIAVGRARATTQPVWVFSGHGSQWTGIGRELLSAEPAFAAEIDRLEPLIAAESGFSLRTALSGAIDRIDHVQPTVFGMQLGLAATWRSYGSEPAAVIGHSMGETAAAVVAGALSAADGVAVICRRSRLMRRLSARAPWPWSPSPAISSSPNSPISPR
nr:acyltransferase domain-containing protein [Nocardia crassostreae]